MAKRIAIIGASRDQSKYGNKAVRAYVAEGYEVIPVNPNAEIIEGLECKKSILDIEGPVDIVSVYLPEAILLKVLDEIAQKDGIETVYLNPGADGPAVIQKATELGLPFKQACSIVAIDRSPSEF